MIGDRCVHVFPRQAREVIIGRFVDPWKDRKCAHGYRLAMRGSIRSATPTSTRRSDLETRGGGRRKKTKRKERSHDQALGCTGHVRLMAKRRYTMAYVSNHIKQQVRPACRGTGSRGGTVENRTTAPSLLRCLVSRIVGRPVFVFHLLPVVNVPFYLKKKKKKKD